MQLLLISSSIVHGYGFLDHSEPDIRQLLAGVRSVAFVPFAQNPWARAVLAPPSSST